MSKVHPKYIITNNSKIIWIGLQENLIPVHAINKGIDLTARHHSKITVFITSSLERIMVKLGIVSPAPPLHTHTPSIEIDKVSEEK